MSKASDNNLQAVPEVLQEILYDSVLKLDTPIMAGGKEITELNYDFRRITARQYIDAMGVEKTGDNFRVTPTQALALFRKATLGMNEGIDEHDLKERMGRTDTVAAIKLGSYFFMIEGRLADTHVKSKS